MGSGRKTLGVVSAMLSVLVLACNEKYPTSPQGFSATSSEASSQRSLSLSARQRPVPRSLNPRASNPKISAVALGSWGSETGIGLGATMLTVSSSSAEFRQTCSTGSISATIVLDENGRFEVTGSFVTPSGGPGVPIVLLPVRFFGTVSGSQMTLNIADDNGRTWGPFVLTLGRSVSIPPCPIL